MFHRLAKNKSSTYLKADYRRTIVSLAGLSLLCHIMADSFAIYTFRNGRYTFKRLAGCMHLMTGFNISI